MPAIEVTERWVDEKCSVSADTGAWAAQRGFDVAFARNEAEALAAHPQFVVGEEHPRIGGFFVDNSTVSTVGPRLFRVMLQYKLNKVDGSSPLLQKPKIRWVVGSCTDAVDRDSDKNPLVNSARIPFDPPLQEEFTTLFLTITKNFPFFDVARALKYSNRLNKLPVTIRGVGTLEPGQLLCRTIMPTGEYTQDTVLIPVAHEFELRRGEKKDSDGFWDGFKRRVMDVGRRAFYDAGKPAQSIIPYSDRKAPLPREVSEDVRLDGYGNTFDEGWLVLGADRKPVEPVDSSSSPPGAIVDVGDYAVFLKYMTKFTEDLNELNL